MFNVLFFSVSLTSVQCDLNWTVFFLLYFAWEPVASWLHCNSPYNCGSIDPFKFPDQEGVEKCLKCRKKSSQYNIKSKVPNLLQTQERNVFVIEFLHLG